MIPSNRISYPSGYVPTQVDNVYSMEFDGTNDYIQTSYTVPAISSYSFSAWFKISAAPAAYSFILADANSAGQGASARAGIGFYQNFFFATMGNGSSVYSDQTSYNISAAYDNNWHNVALVVNGTSQKLYLDGVLVHTYTSSISAGTAGVQNYAIGRYGDYNGHYFTGNIDEVAYWNVVLTPTEIKDIYDATDIPGKKCADLSSMTTPPVAWYRMGD